MHLHCALQRTLHAAICTRPTAATRCTLPSARCTLLPSARCCPHAALCMARSAHCTPHITLRDAHSAPHSARCTACTAHRTLCFPHCTLPTIHCTLCTARCPLHSVHSSPFPCQHIPGSPMSPPPHRRDAVTGWALSAVRAPHADGHHGCTVQGGPCWQPPPACAGVPRCRRLPPPASTICAASAAFPSATQIRRAPPCSTAEPAAHPPVPRSPHCRLLSPLLGVFFSCWQRSFPRRLLRKMLPWAMGRPRRRTSPQVRAAGPAAGSRRSPGPAAGLPWAE